MQLDIRCGTEVGRAAVRRQIEERALFELARYGACIGLVRVGVTQRPPASEHAYHCGVAVAVRHDDGTTGNVLARGQGDDLFRLIETVLARASCLVGGEIERALAAREARHRWLALATAAGARRGS